MNAHETYKERRIRLKVQLLKILDLVAVADELEEETPEYWTHSGTLGHINAELADIIKFMGGRE